MTKYPCGLIEDVIPLYIEGDVSKETKEIVEEHLEECKSCSSLVEEYSDNELKIDDFKEDLPKADTFKKWMKRLKAWGSITAAVVLCAVIAVGVLGYRMGKSPKNDLLTVRTIVKTFEKQGLSLKEDKSQSADSFEIDGVKPVIFNMGDSKDTFLVYTFKSFVEREKAIGKTDRFKNNFSLHEFSFNAKNSFLVYIPSKMPETEEDMKKMGERIALISNTVFKYLNDGKEIIYKGESASWQGTVTLKYYKHWWQDETGRLHYESYHEQYPVMKYKMADKEAVGAIDFEYETNGSSGNATGMQLNKEGYLNAGFSGGNGVMSDEKDIYNITIKWNGKEENVMLKAE